MAQFMLQDRSHRPRKTIDFLVDFNQRLKDEIGYVIRLEPGVQTCDETLDKRSGSCRDSAWLLVNVLRQHGIRGAVCSGYLIQLTADVKSLEGPAGPKRTSPTCMPGPKCSCPARVGSGSTRRRGLCAGEGHIPLACTPEPMSAAPITGTRRECESEFDFEMKVTRIHEDPRVTKPYTDEQWEAIEALGQQVDEHLTRATCG